MYQVWTKDSFAQEWKLTECPDIAAVEEIIRTNFGKEVEVKVSMPVEFDARIAVKVHAPKDLSPTPPVPPAALTVTIKEAKSEVTKSKTKPDKNTSG